MGDPKLSRKVWKKPKRPLNYDLMMEELKILGTFGLKTKRELWKANTELSRVRVQARSLLALRQEDREQQTIVQRKLYFKTPYQARQAIVHGHIMIGDRVVTIPSYTVKIDEESKIQLTAESQFNQTLSKPESDLGSPETEDLEIETKTESNVDVEKKPEVEKPAKE